MSRSEERGAKTHFDGDFNVDLSVDFNVYFNGDFKVDFNVNFTVDFDVDFNVEINRFRALHRSGVRITDIKSLSGVKRSVGSCRWSEVFFKP